jgi:hypothetical protein
MCHFLQERSRKKIPRLWNLQLHRQRCSRLERFFQSGRKYFWFQNAACYPWRCKFFTTLALQLEIVGLAPGQPSSATGLRPRCREQGCQMVSFQTKNSNLGKFFGDPLDWKMLIYFKAIWNILRTFGIFYDHLVYLLSFGTFFPGLVIWQPWLRGSSPR